MANIKQQKKRIGIAQRQRMENLRYRSTIKTLFNRLQLNVDTGDKDAAAATHKELVKLIDRAVNRGTLHRNTAARKKARAARMLLQEPKKDATTIRKAKKKAAPVRKPKAEKKPGSMRTALTYHPGMLPGRVTPSISTGRERASMRGNASATATLRTPGSFCRRSTSAR